MKIAIITLNFNGKQDTVELLKSLGSLKIENLEVKIVVVDNASSDGSVSEIHKKFPKVDTLQTGENIGFGAGYNKGLEYAKIWGADYFFLINNDTKIADPFILEKLIEVMKSDAKIGMVAPKILFEKGFEFYKDKYSKEDLGKVIWYGGGSFDWDNILSVHRGIDEVDNGQYDKTEEVRFISGACFLIKREVLEKVEGFSGDYFLYFEDAELCKKILDEGYKLYYCGQTRIFHKVSRSTGIGSNLTDYYHARNRLIFGMRFANFKAKFALLRESLKLIFSGRKYQKRGILDFYLGKFDFSDLTDARQKGENFEYPFKLSIGIVNYKTDKLTKKLLESIFNKQSGFNEKEMEVIVLDNGSEDNCKEVVKEFLPKIKYLENKENEGFSAGYNKTIKYSLGEYYLMLNSDIEVLPSGLTEMKKAAEYFDGKAALVGKLFFPDGSDQDSVFHLPTLSGAFKEYFLKKNGSYFMYQPKGENYTKVEGAVMACFLIPRNIIQKAGLLDEGTFIYFEDIEYCKRLKKLGISIYFIPSAKFIHYHGASSKVIGVETSQQLLKKAAKHYHGLIYYFFISWILKLGQIFGRVETPKSRWKLES